MKKETLAQVYFCKLCEIFDECLEHFRWLFLKVSNHAQSFRNKNYSYSTFFSDNVWKVIIIKIKIKLPALQ